MKTLEDERYVVIKAYKCTVSEISQGKVRLLLT